MPLFGKSIRSWTTVTPAEELNSGTSKPSTPAAFRRSLEPETPVQLPAYQPPEQAQAPIIDNDTGQQVNDLSPRVAAMSSPIIDNDTGQQVNETVPLYRAANAPVIDNDTGLRANAFTPAPLMEQPLIAPPPSFDIGQGIGESDPRKPINVGAGPRPFQPPIYTNREGLYDEEQATEELQARLEKENQGRFKQVTSNIAAAGLGFGSALLSTAVEKTGAEIGGMRAKNIRELSNSLAAQWGTNYKEKPGATLWDKAIDPDWYATTVAQGAGSLAGSAVVAAIAAVPVMALGTVIAPLGVAMGLSEGAIALSISAYRWGGSAAIDSLLEMASAYSDARGSGKSIEEANRIANTVGANNMLYATGAGVAGLGLAKFSRLLGSTAAAQRLAASSPVRSTLESRLVQNGFTQAAVRAGSALTERAVGGGNEWLQERQQGEIQKAAEENRPWDFVRGVLSRDYEDDGVIGALGAIATGLGGSVVGGALRRGMSGAASTQQAVDASLGVRDNRRPAVPGAPAQQELGVSSQAIDAFASRIAGDPAADAASTSAPAAPDAATVLSERPRGTQIAVNGQTYQIKDRVDGGRTSDTYFADSPTNPDDQIVIKRIKREQGGLKPLIASEYATLQSLHESGASVPRPILLNENPTDGGEPYFIMELAKGARLANIRTQFQDYKIPEPYAVSIGIHILDVIEKLAAKQKGYTDWDLTNIFWNPGVAVIDANRRRLALQDIVGDAKQQAAVDSDKVTMIDLGLLSDIPETDVTGETEAILVRHFWSQWTTLISGQALRPTKNESLDDYEGRLINEMPNVSRTLLALIAEAQTSKGAMLDGPEALTNTKKNLEYIRDTWYGGDTEEVIRQKLGITAVAGVKPAPATTAPAGASTPAPATTAPADAQTTPRPVAPTTRGQRERAIVDSAAASADWNEIESYLLAYQNKDRGAYRDRLSRAIKASKGKYKWITSDPVSYAKALGIIDRKVPRPGGWPAAAGAATPAATVGATATPAPAAGGGTSEPENFSKQNLNGRDFSGQDLTGRDFSGAKLIGAKLDNATLIDATLTDADLTDADLTGAKLTGAKLIGAKLIGAKLLNANLTSAILIDAKLKNADLRVARLTGANLTGADLLLADLRYATLIEANLTGVAMKNTNLSGADLRGAKLAGADLRVANLTSAILIDAKLDNATLTDADLRGANLTGADLSGARMYNARLDGANLEGADLTGAYTFDSKGERIPFVAPVSSATNPASTTATATGGAAATTPAATTPAAAAATNPAATTPAATTPAGAGATTPAGAAELQRKEDEARKSAEDASTRMMERVAEQSATEDYSGQDIRSTDFSGKDLTRNKFIGANMTGAKLTGANLKGVDLTDAKMNRVDLTGADLTGSNLEGADLTGARMDRVRLAGANLEGADLTGAYTSNNRGESIPFVPPKNIVGTPILSTTTPAPAPTSTPAPATTTTTAATAPAGGVRGAASAESSGKSDWVSNILALMAEKGGSISSDMAKTRGGFANIGDLERAAAADGRIVFKDAEDAWVPAEGVELPEVTPERIAAIMAEEAAAARGRAAGARTTPVRVAGAGGIDLVEARDVLLGNAVYVKESVFVFDPENPDADIPMPKMMKVGNIIDVKDDPVEGRQVRVSFAYENYPSMWVNSDKVSEYVERDPALPAKYLDVTPMTKEQAAARLVAEAPTDAEEVRGPRAARATSSVTASYEDNRDAFLSELDDSEIETRAFDIEEEMPAAKTMTMRRVPTSREVAINPMAGSTEENFGKPLQKQETLTRLQNGDFNPEWRIHFDLKRFYMALESGNGDLARAYAEAMLGNTGGSAYGLGILLADVNSQSEEAKRPDFRPETLIDGLRSDQATAIADALLAINYLFDGDQAKIDNATLQMINGFRDKNISSIEKTKYMITYLIRDAVTNVNEVGSKAATMDKEIAEFSESNLKLLQSLIPMREQLESIATNFVDIVRNIAREIMASPRSSKRREDAIKDFNKLNETDKLKFEGLMSTETDSDGNEIINSMYLGDTEFNTLENMKLVRESDVRKELTKVQEEDKESQGFNATAKQISEMPLSEMLEAINNGTYDQGAVIGSFKQAQQAYKAISDKSYSSMLALAMRELGENPTQEARVEYSKKINALLNKYFHRSGSKSTPAMARNLVNAITVKQPNEEAVINNTDNYVNKFSEFLSNAFVTRFNHEYNRFSEAQDTGSTVNVRTIVGSEKVSYSGNIVSINDLAAGKGVLVEIEGTGGSAGNTYYVKITSQNGVSSISMTNNSGATDGEPARIRREVAKDATAPKATVARETPLVPTPVEVLSAPSVETIVAKGIKAKGNFPSAEAISAWQLGTALSFLEKAAKFKDDAAESFIHKIASGMILAGGLSKEKVALALFLNAGTPKKAKEYAEQLRSFDKTLTAKGKISTLERIAAQLSDMTKNSQNVKAFERTTLEKLKGGTESNRTKIGKAKKAVIDEVLAAWRAHVATKENFNAAKASMGEVKDAAVREIVGVAPGDVAEGTFAESTIKAVTYDAKDKGAVRFDIDNVKGKGIIKKLKELLGKNVFNGFYINAELQGISTGKYRITVIGKGDSTLKNIYDALGREKANGIAAGLAGTPAASAEPVTLATPLNAAAARAARRVAPAGGGTPPPPTPPPLVGTSPADPDPASNPIRETILKEIEGDIGKNRYHGITHFPGMFSTRVSQEEIIPELKKLAEEGRLVPYHKTVVSGVGTTYTKIELSDLDAALNDLRRSVLFQPVAAPASVTPASVTPARTRGGARRSSALPRVAASTAEGDTAKTTLEELTEKIDETVAATSGVLDRAAADGLLSIMDGMTPDLEKLRGLGNPEVNKVLDIFAEKRRTIIGMVPSHGTREEVLDPRTETNPLLENGTMHRDLNRASYVVQTIDAVLRGEEAGLSDEGQSIVAKLRASTAKDIDDYLKILRGDKDESDGKYYGKTATYNAIISFVNSSVAEGIKPIGATSGATRTPVRVAPKPPAPKPPATEPPAPAPAVTRTRKPRAAAAGATPAGAAPRTRMTKAEKAEAEKAEAEKEAARVAGDAGVATGDVAEAPVEKTEIDWPDSIRDRLITVAESYGLTPEDLVGKKPLAGRDWTVADLAIIENEIIRSGRTLTPIDPAKSRARKAPVAEATVTEAPVAETPVTEVTVAKTPTVRKTREAPIRPMPKVRETPLENLKEIKEGIVDHIFDTSPKTKTISRSEEKVIDALLAHDSMTLEEAFNLLGGSTSGKALKTLADLGIASFDSAKQAYSFNPDYKTGGIRRPEATASSAEGVATESGMGGGDGGITLPPGMRPPSGAGGKGPKLPDLPIADVQHRSPGWFDYLKSFRNASLLFHPTGVVGDLANSVVGNALVLNNARNFVTAAVENKFGVAPEKRVMTYKMARTYADKSIGGIGKGAMDGIAAAFNPRQYLDSTSENFTLMTDVFEGKTGVGAAIGRTVLGALEAGSRVRIAGDAMAVSIAKSGFAGAYAEHAADMRIQADSSLDKIKTFEEERKKIELAMWYWGKVKNEGVLDASTLELPSGYTRDDLEEIETPEWENRQRLIKQMTLNSVYRGEMAEILPDLGNLRANNPAIAFMIPFAQTLARVGYASADAMPIVGQIMLGLDIQRGKYGKDATLTEAIQRGMTQQQIQGGRGLAAHRVANQILGLSLAFVGGMLYAMKALMADGPDDEQEKAAWLDEGNRPFSLVIGGTSYNIITLLGPAAAPMMAGAKIYQEFFDDTYKSIEITPEKRKTVLGHFEAISKSTLQWWVNNTILRNFQDILNAAQGRQAADAMQKFGANSLMGFLPGSGLLRYITKQTDPYFRDPQNFLDYVNQNLPIEMRLGDMPVPVKRNDLGQAIQKTATERSAVPLNMTTIRTQRFKTPASDKNSQSPYRMIVSDSAREDYVNSRSYNKVMEFINKKGNAPRPTEAEIELTASIMKRTKAMKLSDPINPLYEIRRSQVRPYVQAERIVRANAESGVTAGGTK